jgi:Putative zinc-finger
MTTTCISEPVSYLRLERYLVDEVGGSERAELQAHLAQCEACRQCFEGLRADVAVLPPLPSVPPPTRIAPRAVIWPVLAVAAAALLFLSRPDTESPMAGAVTPGTKGGDLAVKLVREHQGSVAVDASRYVSGDRFEVQVTCPPGNPVRWDVVVLQEGQAFFPLTPSTSLQCANHVTLPGAFTLTGDTPARICVVTHPTTPPDRARLARELPATSACVEVTPAR